MPKARINFAPHAYMYSEARSGSEIDTNAYVALYSRKNKAGKKFDSHLQGVEPCPDSDVGRIQIDPMEFTSRENLCQVHLHPVDHEQMAISPNNMAFLLNLTLPIVSFTIALLFKHSDRSNRLAIFNVTFLNDDAFAAGQLQVALSSSELIRQTIITSSAYQHAKLN
jgi:hypothetical protein